MSQYPASTYGHTLDVAQAGQKYDTRPDWVVSYSAEVVLEGGDPVRLGTDKERQVLKGNKANGVFGIALFPHTTEQVNTSGTITTGYAIKDTVPVLRKGAVWVVSGVTVVPGDPVYVTPSGTYTNIDDSDANFLVPSGTYLTGGDATELVVVELA